MFRPHIVGPVNLNTDCGIQRKQEREVQLINRLNRAWTVRYPNDSDLKARIKSYELAFRMQMAVPEALALKDESEETKRLYRLDNKITEPFGSVCLEARRVSKCGVRFVQVPHGGGQGLDWDAHSNLNSAERRVPAVENRHYVTDIHATVLHQLGLDPKRLVVPGHKWLDIELGTPIQAITA
jgi:Protein of unknown function (DUF1501)